MHLVGLRFQALSLLAKLLPQALLPSLLHSLEPRTETVLHRLKAEAQDTEVQAISVFVMPVEQAI